MPYRPRARAVARPVGFSAVIVMLAMFLTAVGLAPASAEGTGSISGTVTNTRGEPLPGSSVRAFVPDGSPIRVVVARATADEHGRFTLTGLSAGEYGVHAYGPDGTEYLGEVWDDADSWQTPTVVSLAEGEARDGIDFRLAVAGVVTGVVTDAEGVPLPGASVRLQQKLASGGTPNDIIVTTDESGAYEIRRLDPGPWAASFSLTTSPSSADAGYVPVRYVPVEVQADTVVRLDMSLTKASSITGSVVDSRGDAVPGFTADLWRLRDGRWENVETAWFGEESYAFPGLPAGTYAVLIDPDGDAAVAQWWGGRHAAWGGEDPNGLSPAAIELDTGATFTADVVLDVGARVRGTVVDAHGEPIGSKRIVLHLERDGGWDAFRTAYSGADGTFELSRVPAGTYTLEFPEAADVHGEWWTDAPTRLEAQRLEIDEGAVISGVHAVLERRSVSSSVPVVSGPTSVGSTLTVSAVSDTPGASFAYAWFADGVPLEGSSGAVLELGPEQAGRMITARVTTSAPGYASVTSESSPVGPIALGTLASGTPTISGTPQVRSELIADPGVWTGGTTFTYRWFANGVAIPGATQPSLRPTVAEVGMTITVMVTGSRPGFADVSTTSAPSAKVKSAESTTMSPRPDAPPPTAPPRAGADGEVPEPPEPLESSPREAPADWYAPSSGSP